MTSKNYVPLLSPGTRTKHKQNIGTFGPTAGMILILVKQILILLKQKAGQGDRRQARLSTDLWVLSQPRPQAVIPIDHH